MLNNLPVQYRRDPWLIVLAAALQVPMDRQGEVIRSLPNQISLDRVTWHLPGEEPAGRGHRGAAPGGAAGKVA